VHFLCFRERERLSHEASQPLTQNVVEALNMARLPRALPGRSVLGFRQHLGISCPEVGVKQAYFVSAGNALPQQAAGLLAPAAEGVSNDLASATALRQPHPTLVFAPENKRPEFIEFQRIVALRGRQSCGQGQQFTRFF